MPHDPKKYPPDWKKISVQVTFGRARGRCENCGAVAGYPHPVTNGTVVLSACHTCDCEPLCGNLDHLRGWCQKCHLAFDSERHVRAARATLRRKLVEGGQLDMFNDEGGCA